MLLNLSKINEGLEKTYKLNESNELTEKLSDSMPDWLKKRLLTTKYSQGDAFNRRDLGLHKYDTSYPSRGKRDAAAKKNPEEGPRPTYANVKGSGKYGDKSLFTTMLDKGINLDSVKIIEGDKPEKRTDPRLKEPNIPIFLFKNGQVYVKGMNDNEEYSGDQSYKAFKYLPMKTLLSDETTGFAYIDGNDDSNFLRNTRITSRSISRTELDRIPNYYRPKDKDRAGKNLTTSYGHRDKSGYLVIPTVQKYEKQLAELKCDKIFDILKEKEDYLNEVKEELANILLNADLKNDLDNGNSDYSKAFGNIFKWLKEAVHYFKEVEDTLDYVVNDPATDDEGKRNMIVNIINNDWDYKQLNNTIKKIEKESANVFNATIDWI